MPLTRWYPIECPHGYDRCPMCDKPEPEPNFKGFKIVEDPTVPPDTIIIKEGK